ncbi:MAG: UbiX family flavin prenyltransferase [Chloroflexi bacterium]|nr:UbiX family flavin prenyltransferase [Chloroflexota bacterium]
MRRMVIGMSGASGSVYGVRLLEVLRDIPDIETHLVLSDAAPITLRQEMGLSPQDVQALADRWYRARDIAAPIASGSFLVDGMVVAPCSVRTLSGLAYSQSDNLLLRAGDVMLKERRPLILMLRETPLHLGHLRAMTRVAEMGAIMAPPIPAFYHHPQTIDDLVDHSVGKVLDLLGIEHSLFRRWEGLGATEESGE